MAKTATKTVKVNKAELKESATELATSAEMTQFSGAVQVQGGVGALQDAKEMGKQSRKDLVKGTTNVTRGVDKMIVAGAAASIGDTVGFAGVNDVMQGEEMLDASERIAMQTAIVQALGEHDLDRGMDLAAIAGQLWAVSEMLESIDMPVLSAFLETKGHELQDIAVDSLLRATAAHDLADSMEETGLAIGELGANEVDEGEARLAAAQAFGEASEQLAAEGAAQAIQGATQVAAAKSKRKAKQELQQAAVTEIAEGAAKVGAAQAMGATAEVLDDATK
jgi:hypothetical protein